MEELFTRFDLKTKESSAFLELVRLGATPVSRWAKHAGINRSSMYVLLDRLVKTGLVTSFTHKGILHVQAIHMAELTALLNDREDYLSNTRALLLKNLPELQKLEKTHGITPKVKFFEGKHRVETMYEEVLKETSFKSFFHPARVKALMPAYFHKIPETLKARGGSAEELLVLCKEAEEYQATYQSKLHHIAILPKGITFSSDTIITKDKVFLVGYSPTDVVATEIWNEELAQTQSAVFDFLWTTNSMKK